MTNSEAPNSATQPDLASVFNLPIDPEALALLPIDKQAVALAIEARDMRLSGEYTPGTLQRDLARLAACMVREDVANSYEDADSSHQHRQEAISCAADLAGRALLVLANLLAHTCHVCGCTDEAGCPEGCSWVHPGLCSSCGPAADPETDPVDDYDKMTPFQVAIAGIIPEANDAH